MRHLVRTSEGTLHSFIQMGTNTTKCGSGGLWWLYSTDSGTTWTCGGQLSSDTSNLMYADVKADGSDNLYIVYSVAGTGGNAAYDVSYRRLTSTNCSPAPCDWTLQSAQIVLDGDASGDNAGFHYATLELESSTRAWIAYREFDGTNYQVGVLYSDALSNAPTWTESVATLDTAGTNASYHYPAIARYGTNLGIIWNDQVSGDLYWRSRADSDGLTTWNSASQIANRLTRFPTFSALGDSSGNIYLSVQDSNVSFYHFFSSWSAGAIVATPSVSDQFSSVSTDGTNVYVAYGDTTGITGGVNRKLAYKKGVPPFGTANFDASPTGFASYHSTFDQVWLYDASANTYENETTDSSSTTAADIAHSDSTRIVNDTGDMAYLGKSTTFDAISWVVSSVSAGGTNTWEYCSAVDATPTCTTWTPITFTGSQNSGWKGNGYAAFNPPGDWQASKVNGEGTAYYYVRDQTTSSYTTGPIGTQLTTIPLSSWPSLAASTNGLYVLWTENVSSPMRVRYSTLLSFNTNPNAPTSLSGHVSGDFTSDTTPTMSFNLSDGDASDTVKYNIQIDDSSDFSSPLINYTSALSSQGSFSFTVGQSESGGSYATGSSGQTLSDGSYYWKVKAIDDDNGESSFTIANSGSIAFKVDVTAPSIPGTPASSSQSADSTPTWTWTASTDSGSGLSATPYSLEWSQSSSFASGVSSATSSTNSYTHSSGLSDGVWYFRVKSSDSVGNVSGFSSAGSFTVDTTIPTTLELDFPGDYAYTNSDRPTFKWKTSNDTSSLIKYVLEIDNPSLGSDHPSGDFILNDIPLSGTSDYVSDKYVVKFDNFADSDADNNYVSVYTKSHSSWGATENDGKLYEGKVIWKVKAVDNQGGESISVRTLFVDRTNPSLELTQVNSISHTTSNYSTTDSTPSFFGKITDFLTGGDQSQVQEKTGPRVASGPNKVEVKVEKETTLGYELLTIYTINADKIYYTCNGKEVVDNTKQQCDKYLLFQYTSEQNLANGVYRITFSGNDKAGNQASQTVISLEIVSSGTTATTVEKKSPTPSSTTTSTKTTTDTTSTTSTSSTKTLAPTSTDEDEEKLKTMEETTALADESESLIIKVFSEIGETVEKSLVTSPDSLKIIASSIGEGISSVTDSVATLTQQVATGTTNLIQNTENAIRSSLANLAFILGDATKNIAGNFSLAVIEWAYNFVPEPTTISQVKVEVLSPTSAKITWETNHPSNGKVNYGLDRTYPQDVQSEERVKHHEFILTDLKPDTTYHFEVMSHSKNYVYDANREFKTPAAE
jgi:hypothetical protein